MTVKATGWLVIVWTATTALIRAFGVPVPFLVVFGPLLAVALLTAVAAALCLHDLIMRWRKR